MDITNLSLDVSDPTVVDDLIGDARTELNYRSLPYTESVAATLVALHERLTLAALATEDDQVRQRADRQLREVRRLQEDVSRQHRRLTKIGEDETRYFGELLQAFFRLAEDTHLGRPISHTGMWAAETFPSLLPFATATGKRVADTSAGREAAIRTGELLREFVAVAMRLEEATTDELVASASNMCDGLAAEPAAVRERLGWWLADVRAAAAFTQTFAMPEVFTHRLYQPGGPGQGLSALGAAVREQLVSDIRGLETSYQKMELGGDTVSLLHCRHRRLYEFVVSGQMTVAATPASRRLADQLASDVEQLMTVAAHQQPPVRTRARWRALLGR